MFLRRCYQLLHHNASNKFLPNKADLYNLRKVCVSVRLDRKNFRSPVKYSRSHVAVSATDADAKDGSDSGTVTASPNPDTDVDDIPELQNYLERNLYLTEIGHRVLVIQPYVKFGPGKKTLTTPQLQLNEAVALIKTLRNWKVVDQMIISLKELTKIRLFGSGQLDYIKDRITSNSKITAVFVSINMLKPIQQASLQETFGVPVYDRYTVVIHIFREHARTKEAKLQIKLAELPYLWSRFKHIKNDSLVHFGGEASTIGTSWKGKEFHEQLLKEREAKIMQQIQKLRQHRKLTRKARIRNEIPTVAVVGYTNSGKTSLIKALTGKEKLEPQDYLFATLDVTVHEGKLPSTLKVLYVDTIGFMSDIPTILLESFVSTLEDVRIADVIIHVRDISHPDNVAQNQNVLETLDMLELPEKLSNNMITVGNKIDLLGEEDKVKYRGGDMILISASKMIGTDILLQKIEEYVLRATGRKVIVVKVKTGGDEYCWLHENTTVIDESPFSENHQYVLMRVIITEIAMARFKHIFIKEYYKTR